MPSSAQAAGPPRPAGAPASDAESPQRHLATSSVGALVAPVEGTATRTPAATSPAEVLPQQVHRAAPKVTKSAPTRRLQPGDLICGACGEGNPPTRKFCSRCGESLRQAEVVARRWWQRLRFTRRHRSLPAGRRPDQKGAPRRPGAMLKTVWRRVYRLIGALSVVGAVLYLAVPPLRGVVNDTIAHPVSALQRAWNERFNVSFVPVRPVTVNATAAAAGHPAPLAFDQLSNTYWAAPATPAQQPRLQIRFGGPTTVERIIVTAGGAEDFVKLDRPKTLHLVYDKKRSDTITLNDEAKPQTLTLDNAGEVTEVEIVVTDVYQAATPGTVAIAEIELFRRE